MVVAVRAEAVITAQNRLRPGLAASTRDLERFRSQQTKAMSAFGSASARALGVIGGALAGFSATRALSDATKRFAEVDRAMTRTGITGDATVQQTRRGAEELRNLARETATLFDPAQKGLDAITASGRDFADAMKMMPSVLKTAQASGAGVDDIANSSTALLDHMKISIAGLAEAQDTLAMGGKLGKFELKDMARYLPSMLPAVKALGVSGQDGLRQLVAMLQVIRAGSGSAEEAASSASNIFQKMESEETAKKFAKMGVNLRKEMAKARKDGKNLLDVFVDLSEKALKGDLSKIPQLFSDTEFSRGMRALLGGREKQKELLAALLKAGGTIDRDFKRVTDDAQANLDRFKEAADRAKTAIGGIAAELSADQMKSGASNLDAVAQAMERAAEAARSDGFIGVVKSLGGALANGVRADIKEGSAGIDEQMAAAKDRDTVHRIGQRAGMVNARPTDPREVANMRDEIARLQGRTQTPQVRARLQALRERMSASVKSVDLTPDEWGAVSRDQQRMQGLPGLRLDMTSSSSEFDGAREAAREARRAAGFGGGITASGRNGAILPPPRPGSLKGAIDIPVQPLDDVQSKVSAVANSFSLLGPAAQTAGSEMSVGVGVALTQMQQLEASIARVKQGLATMKAPNIGSGLGGFDTGRQGPN